MTIDDIKRSLLPFTPQWVLDWRARERELKRIKAEEDRIRADYVIAAAETAAETGCTFSLRNKTIEIYDGGDRLLILSASHLVYINDFMRMFDYFFNMVEPVRRWRRGKWLMTVYYSRPRLHRLKKSGILFYFSSMAEDLDITEGYLKQYRPKAGETVIDCGAYCGTSAYIFSQLVGSTGRVFALEPDAISYRMLLKNIKRHRLTNVIPLNIGIWSTTGTLSFNADGGLGSGANLILQRGFFKSLIEIPVFSLEDFCRLYNIGRGCLIKMDIEGSELEVIRGSLNFIGENTFEFAVASYHLVGGQMTCNRLEELFGQAGYRAKSERTFEGQDNGSLVTYARKE